MLDWSLPGRHSIVLFVAFGCFVIAIAFFGLVSLVSLLITRFVGIGCFFVFLILVFLVTVVTIGRL